MEEKGVAVIISIPFHSRHTMLSTMITASAIRSLPRLRQFFPQPDIVLGRLANKADHADEANEANDATACELASLDGLHGPQLEFHLITTEDLSCFDLVQAKIAPNLHSTSFFSHCFSPLSISNLSSGIAPGPRLAP